MAATASLRLRSAYDNAALRRLVLAHAVSTVGYWGATTALLVYAYDQGGTWLVGVAAFVRVFPAAVASPFAGALADRHPRERVLLVGDLLRMVTMGVVATCVALGAPEVFVLTLAAVNAALFSSFRPAMRALTPALSRTTEQLTAANVMASAVESVGMLAGPAIGGVLLVASGPAVVFAAAAATLGLSAALVAGLRPRPGSATVARDSPAAPRASLLSEMREGARAVAGDGSLRLIMLLTAGQTLSYGALSVLIVSLGTEVLDAGDGWVGYLNAALGLGGLVGALTVVPRLVGRLTTSAAGGLVLWGLPLCAIGLWPNRAAAIAAIVVIGVTNTLVDVTLNTMLQRVAPADALARVFAMLGTVAMGAIAIGGLLTPALVALLGTRGALVAVGLLLPLLVLCTVPALRVLAARVAATVPAAAWLRGVPLLAELPAAALEELARRAALVRAGVDAVVVADGQPGSRFYVIVDGRADVSVEGRLVRRLQAGDCFGESALLRDAPGNATVRAVGELRLLALERADFVAAVARAAGLTGVALEGHGNGSIVAAAPRHCA